MRAARILVLRGGAIGDFIVTLPALQVLRERWPDAHIELIGYPHVARLAEIAGIVNRVESLDRAPIARLFATRFVLDESQTEFFRSFDIILNYLHDPDGSVAENFRQTGAPLVIHRDPLVTGQHAVDHFLEPLQQLALYASGRTPNLKILPSPDAPRDYIAIAPGSGSPKKNWPTENFVMLAKRFKQRIIFIIGEADEAAEAVLKREMPDAEIWKQLPLPELAARLTTCAHYIGNDSGISHLAAALGIRTLALFGPTDPELWAPRGPRAQIIRAPNADFSQITVELIEKLISA